MGEPGGSPPPPRPQDEARALLWSVVLRALETIDEHVALLVLVVILGVLETLRRLFPLGWLGEGIFGLTEAFTGCLGLQQLAAKVGGLRGMKRALLGRPDKK